MDLRELFRLPSHTQAITHSLAAVCALLLFIYNYREHAGYTVDDAFISFRYLDNWLQGQGLVFNPGERVEGYTNFLWIVALAPLRLLGLDAATAALLLNLCFLMVTGFALYQTLFLLSQRRDVAWAAILLLSGFGSLAYWVAAGLEPVMLACLLSLAAWQTLKTNAITPTVAALLALSTLVRPDALLFALVAFACYLPVKQRGNREVVRNYLIAALVYVLPLLAHLSWRWFYYGEFLPNTYYAKSHPDSELMLRFGWAYFLRFQTAGGLIFSLLILAGLFSGALRNRFVLMILLQILIFCLYIIKVGGDYMLYFRFFTPILPLLVIIGSLSLQKSLDRLNLPVISIPALALSLAIAQSWLLSNSSDMQQAPGVRQGHSDNQQLAQWLKDNLPSQTRLAMNLVGAVPYITQMHTIDMLGLNNKHIARGKVAPLRAGISYIGHFKYDGDYVCRQQPDIMIPGTIGLHSADNVNQALWQALQGLYDSDREFLEHEQCKDSYAPFVKEIQTGQYIVFYIRKGFLQRLRQGLID